MPGDQEFLRTTVATGTTKCLVQTSAILGCVRLRLRLRAGGRAWWREFAQACAHAAALLRLVVTSNNGSSWAIFGTQHVPNNGYKWEILAN